MGRAKGHEPRSWNARVTGEPPLADGPFRGNRRRASRERYAARTDLRRRVRGVSVSALHPVNGWRAATTARCRSTGAMPLGRSASTRPRSTFPVLAVPRLSNKVTRAHLALNRSSARRRTGGHALRAEEWARGHCVGHGNASSASSSRSRRATCGATGRLLISTVDIDKLRREETVVPVGAYVSVSGRWSSERRALVPGAMGDGELGATLVTGTAEKLERDGSSALPGRR